MIGTKIGRADRMNEGEVLFSGLAGGFPGSLSGFITIFLANLTAKNHPAKSATRLIGNPRRMTKPRSAPRIPAAATGPGVGGMMECVTYKPRLNSCDCQGAFCLLGESFCQWRKDDKCGIAKNRYAHNITNKTHCQRDIFFAHQVKHTSCQLICAS